MKYTVKRVTYQSLKDLNAFIEKNNILKENIISINKTNYITIEMFYIKEEQDD